MYGQMPQSGQGLLDALRTVPQRLEEIPSQLWNGAVNWGRRELGLNPQQQSDPRQQMEQQLSNEMNQHAVDKANQSFNPAIKKPLGGK